MSAVLEHPKRHPVTTQEYLRMAQAGVFEPDARLELIEGEIIEMAPIGHRHGAVVAILNRTFQRSVENRAVVWVQSGVIADDHSVPQPDLALLEPRVDTYFHAPPTGADTLLVVEVSESTLAFDRGRKLQLYCRDGFREAWIVDLVDRCVLVHRDPSANGYSAVFRVEIGGRVECAALPQVRVEVAELFPK